MKKQFVTLIISSACALSALNLQAADAPTCSDHCLFSEDNVYVTAGIGALFQDEIRFNQNIGGFSIEAPATFDPGIRASIGVGYNITPALSAEFETGVLWNSIDKL